MMKHTNTFSISILERRPEKLETFDAPEPTEASSDEDEAVTENAGKTLRKNPALKPGHRFFILNGQPLFSNYPLPQFSKSPYQPSFYNEAPSPTNFGDVFYRQNDLPYFPDSIKPQYGNGYHSKVPSDNLFLRNSVTGHFGNIDVPHNDIEVPLNSAGVNAQTGYIRGAEPLPVLVKAIASNHYDDNERNNKKFLRPIEVPDEIDPFYEENVKDGISNFDYPRIQSKNEADDDKESVVIEAKSEENTDESKKDEEGQ